MRAPTRRLLLVLSALLLLAGGLGRALLSSSLVRDRVRARVEKELDARVGEVQVGHGGGAWGLLGVWLGPIDVQGRDVTAVHVDRFKVSVRPWPLLTGRVELDKLALEGVGVTPGEGARELRAVVDRVRARRERAPAAASPSSPAEARHLALELAGLRLPQGPALAGALSVKREGGRSEARLELQGNDGARLSLTASASTSRSATLRLSRWSARSLLELAGPSLASRVEGGTLSGEVRATSNEEETTARVELGAEELFVRDARLGPEAIGPLGLSVDLPVHVGDGVVSIHEGRLALGGNPEATVLVDAKTQLPTRPTEAPGLFLRLRAQHLAFGELLASLPPVLRPPPPVSAVKGDLDAELRLQMPGKDGAPELTGKINLDRFRRLAQAQDALGLRGEFVHVTESPPRKLRVGPSNPYFVPAGALPPYLVQAVLLSEDSWFFVHQGFDLASLFKHLVGGPDPRGVVRGGSTLTQQLAKNLYLSREKTYVRKVREALATLALEASLPKQRLLEIYFNLIEWGPDVNGIGEAAEHYFARQASDLTVREAAFLATIIPSPVRYHASCSRGALSEAWEKRVAELLTKMHDAGALTDEQLEQGLTQRLVFAHRARAAQR